MFTTAEYMEIPCVSLIDFRDYIAVADVLILVLRPVSFFDLDYKRPRGQQLCGFCQILLRIKKLFWS